jgi:hypothetical protein
MKSEASRLALICGLIFVAALSARVLLLALLHREPSIEFAEMELLAKSLAETGTLANPYSLPTGPSAHHAPFFPFLLSLIFRWLGYGRGAALAMTGMTFVFASAQYALLPLLAAKSGLPVSVGAVAGAFGAIPFRIVREAKWETSMNGLILLLCTFAALHWIRSLETDRFRTSAIVGLFYGVAMIAVPMYLPVLLILAAAAVLRGMSLRKPRLFQQAAVLLLCAAIGVSPWIVRNYLQFRALVFVRSNYPLEFNISNNDDSYPLATDNFSIGFPHNFITLHHPGSNQTEARLVQQLGEIAYNRACLANALRWCSQHKAKFIDLTVQRFFLFWFPLGGTQPVKALLLAGVALAGLFGAVLMQIRKNTDLRIPVLALLIGFPIPYYFIQIDTRYRYPVEWCLFLLAAYLGNAAVQSYLAKRSPSLAVSK